MSQQFSSRRFPAFPSYDVLYGVDVDAHGQAGRTWFVLDPDTGATWLDCTTASETGTPSDYWHGVRLRTPITSALDLESLTQAINAGAIDAEIAAICDGHTVEWDGSNHVGRMSAAASAAWDRIGVWLDAQITLADRFEHAGSWDAYDWFGPADDECGVTATTTDAELDEIEERVEEDARAEYVILYHTRSYLESVRERLQQTMIPCECGQADGDEPCGWDVPISEMVTVEYMPRALRSQHQRAGYTTISEAGVWPANGAIRLRVSIECADRFAQSDSDWSREIKEEA